MRLRAGIVFAAVLWVTPLLADAIAPYGRGTFAEIKAAHATKPLVVHFWSVTCIPCLTEMPRLADALRTRKDFDLVLVSTDPIARSERIAARLDTFGLTDAPNYAFADSFQERLRFEADRTWRGELPFSVLVKPGGETTTVVGELEPDALARWLDEGHRR